MYSDPLKGSYMPCAVKAGATGTNHDYSDRVPMSSRSRSCAWETRQATAQSNSPIRVGELAGDLEVPPGGGLLMAKEKGGAEKACWRKPRYLETSATNVGA